MAIQVGYGKKYSKRWEEVEWPSKIDKKEGNDHVDASVPEGLPSEICKTRNIQNCQFCDDLECGDNTSVNARKP